MAKKKRPSLAKAAADAGQLDQKELPVGRAWFLEQHATALVAIETIVINLRKRLAKTADRKGGRDLEPLLDIVRTQIPEAIRNLAPVKVIKLDQIQGANGLCESIESLVDDARKSVPAGRSKLQQELLQQLGDVQQRVQARAGEITEAKDAGQQTKKPFVPDWDPVTPPEPEVPLTPVEEAYALVDVYSEKERAKFIGEKLVNLLHEKYWDFLSQISEPPINLSEQVTAGTIKNLSTVCIALEAHIGKICANAQPLDLQDMQQALLLPISLEKFSLPPAIEGALHTTIISSLRTCMDGISEDEEMVYMLSDIKEHIRYDNADDIQTVLLWEKVEQGEDFPLQQFEREYIAGRTPAKRRRIKSAAKKADLCAEIAVHLNTKYHGGFSLRSMADIQRIMAASITPKKRRLAASPVVADDKSAADPVVVDEKSAADPVVARKISTSAPVKLQPESQPVISQQDAAAVAAFAQGLPARPIAPAKAQAVKEQSVLEFDKRELDHMTTLIIPTGITDTTDVRLHTELRTTLWRSLNATLYGDSDKAVEEVYGHTLMNQAITAAALLKPVEEYTPTVAPKSEEVDPDASTQQERNVALAMVRSCKKIDTALARRLRMGVNIKRGKDKLSLREIPFIESLIVETLIELKREDEIATAGLSTVVVEPVTEEAPTDVEPETDVPEVVEPVAGIPVAVAVAVELVTDVPEVVEPVAGIPVVAEPVIEESPTDVEQVAVKSVVVTTETVEPVAAPPAAETEIEGELELEVLHIAMRARAAMIEEWTTVQASIKRITGEANQLDAQLVELESQADTLGETMGNLITELFSAETSKLFNHCRIEIDTGDFKQSPRADIQQSAEFLKSAITKLQIFKDLQAQLEKMREAINALHEEYKTLSGSAQRAQKFHSKATRETFGVCMQEFLPDEDRDRLQEIPEFIMTLDAAKEEVGTVDQSHIRGMELSIEQAGIGVKFSEKELEKAKMGSKHDKQSPAQIEQIFIESLQIVQAFLNPSAKAKKEPVPKPASKSAPKPSSNGSANVDSLPELTLSELQTSLIKLMTAQIGNRHPRHTTWGFTAATIRTFWIETFGGNDTPSEDEICTALSDAQLTGDVPIHAMNYRPSNTEMHDFRRAPHYMTRWANKINEMFLPTHRIFDYAEQNEMALKEEEFDLLKTHRDAQKADRQKQNWGGKKKKTTKRRTGGNDA